MLSHLVATSHTKLFKFRSNLKFNFSVSQVQQLKWLVEAVLESKDTENVRDHVKFCWKALVRTTCL